MYIDEIVDDVPAAEMLFDTRPESADALRECVPVPGSGDVERPAALEFDRAVVVATYGPTHACPVVKLLAKLL
jgi:predicted dehydrogenase